MQERMCTLSTALPLKNICEWLCKCGYTISDTIDKSVVFISNRQYQKNISKSFRIQIQF